MATVAHPATTGTTRLGLVTGAACAAAGILHGLAAVDHADAGWWVPAFFALVAVVQLGAGAWLMVGEPDRRLVVAVLVGTTALVCLFLVVHGTTWLGDLAGHPHEAGGGHAVAHTGPVSLGAEGPEAADALGLATVAVQCLALATGTLLLPDRLRQRTADGLLGLGAVVVLLWMTGVLA